MKDRVSDIKKITGDLDIAIGILENTYALTLQLADATHAITGDTEELEATTDEIRDNLSDFVDFFTPIKSYFYWEPHCYDIPICWALRATWDSIDNADRLTENTEALVKDTKRVDELIPQVAAQLPPLIAVMKSIQATTKTIYSSFDSLVI